MQSPDAYAKILQVRKKSAHSDSLEVSGRKFKETPGLEEFKERMRSEMR